MGDRTNVVRVEPLGFRFLTKTLATCVAEDVSKYLYILTFEVPITLEGPPF